VRAQQPKKAEKKTQEALDSRYSFRDGLARFVLGQAVLHVLRKDAVLRHWYKGIKRRRGSKIARVAVMRRLTTILWHVLHKQQPYVLGGSRVQNKTQAQDEPMIAAGAAKV
jgi:hypothetical protein